MFSIIVIFSLKLIVILHPQLYKKNSFCSYIILSRCSRIYAGFSASFSFATLSVIFSNVLYHPHRTVHHHYTVLYAVFPMYSITPIVLQPGNTDICVYFFSPHHRLWCGGRGGPALFGSHVVARRWQV